MLKSPALNPEHHNNTTNTVVTTSYDEEAHKKSLSSSAFPNAAVKIDVGVPHGLTQGVDYYGNLKRDNDHRDNEVIFSGLRRNRIDPWIDRNDARGSEPGRRNRQGSLCAKQMMLADVTPESFNFLADQSMKYLKIDGNWMKSNFRRFLLPAMKSAAILKDYVMFREGDRGTMAYLVEDGTLRVVDSEGIVIQELKKGAVLGVRSMLFDFPREFTVVCAQNGRVWSIDRSAYFDLQRAVHAPSLSVTHTLSLTTHPFTILTHTLSHVLSLSARTQHILPIPSHTCSPTHPLTHPFNALSHTLLHSLSYTLSHTLSHTLVHILSYTLSHTFSTPSHTRLYTSSSCRSMPSCCLIYWKSRLCPMNTSKN